MAKDEIEEAHVNDAKPGLYATIPDQGNPKPGQLTRKELEEYFDKVSR